MSGSGSHPALPLSDALSARSYFEFGLDEIQAPVRLESGPAPSNSRTISNSPTSRESIEIPRKSGPHLRRRGRQPIPKESEKTETAPNAQDPLQGNDRPVRKRGRPRIETAKDAAAIEVCNGQHCKCGVTCRIDGGAWQWSVRLSTKTYADSRNVGTPLANQAGTAHIPPEEGGDHSDSQDSRRATRTGPPERVRSPHV